MPEAVAERARHQALLDHDAVVGERQAARQQRRHLEQLGLGLERRQQLPEERDGVGRQRHEDREIGEHPERPPHAATELDRSVLKYAHATAMTSRNTTTLTAEPKPSWSVWKSARYA